MNLICHSGRRRSGSSLAGLEAGDAFTFRSHLCGGLKSLLLLHGGGSESAASVFENELTWSIIEIFKKEALNNW